MADRDLSRYRIMASYIAQMDILIQRPLLTLLGYFHGEGNVLLYIYSTMSCKERALLYIGRTVTLDSQGDVKIQSEDMHW